MTHISKILLLIVLPFLPEIHLQAQTIRVESKDGTFRSDTVAKQVLDYPLYRVYYDYVCVVQPDATPLMGREGMTVLLIGKQYNMFRDYMSLRKDSIFDLSAKEKWPSGEALNMTLNLGAKTMPGVVVFDRKAKTYSMNLRLPLNGEYIYEEAAGDMAWTLVPGDTIISGFNCKKATLAYRGRSYVAWYTEEIDMPYGPYKFNGLPGLIMRIRDTQKHHTFTFVGMTKTAPTDLIYTNPRAFGCKREWIRKSIRNYYDDPVKGIESSGTVKLSEEDKRDIKKRPYNPIELE